VSGGTNTVLRALRAAVLLSPPQQGNDNGSRTDVIAMTTLAPQLRLLASCCRHLRVAEATQPLAAAEGGIERIVHLLSQPSDTSSAATTVQEGHAAAAALVSSWAQGSKGKSLFAPHAKPLAIALVELLSSTSVDVQASAVTAIGNLSAGKAFRKHLVTAGVAPKMLGVIRQAGVHAEVLLPNALAALHNCSLIAEVMEAVTTDCVASLLLPYVTAKCNFKPSRLLVRRAAAILAKGAARNRAITTMMLSDNGGALRSVAQIFEAEVVHLRSGVQHEEDVVDPTCEEEDELENYDNEEAEGGGLLDSSLRLLTACSREESGARVICDAGSLPFLVQLLNSPIAKTNLHGNSALCIADCAKEPRCLAVLAVQPVVPALLDLAHHKTGQVQKKFSVALARLAKNPHCLQAIRDNHGIEILARSMPKMNM